MSYKGMTLVETLVGMAVGSIVLLSIGSLVQTAYDYKSDTTELACVNSLRSYITGQLYRDMAWRNTLNDPANIAGPFAACFAEGCVGTPFRIRDFSNNIIFDPLTASPNRFSAFTTKCKPCDAVADGVNCPLRLNLSYAFANDPNLDTGCQFYGPCNNPVPGFMWVMGSFTTTVAPKTPVNLNKFSFQVWRSAP